MLCYRISYGTGASGTENKAGGRKEPSKLANDLEHLLDNSTLTDVTIKCDKCIKAILSAFPGHQVRPVGCIICLFGLLDHIL